VSLNKQQSNPVPPNLYVFNTQSQSLYELVRTHLY